MTWEYMDRWNNARCNDMKNMIERNAVRSNDIKNLIRWDVLRSNVIALMVQWHSNWSDNILDPIPPSYVSNIFFPANSTSSVHNEAKNKMNNVIERKTCLQFQFVRWSSKRIFVIIFCVSNMHTGHILAYLVNTRPRLVITSRREIQWTLSDCS